MTTIDLRNTDHRIYSHGARTYIDQATLDAALTMWRGVTPGKLRDELSIFDGSEDVVYAFAWLDGGEVCVTMLQYDEDAAGYPVDALPFSIDIEHTEPEPEPEPVEQAFLTRITSSKELFPLDLRKALQSIDKAADIDVRKAY